MDKPRYPPVKWDMSVATPFLAACHRVLQELSFFVASFFSDSKVLQQNLLEEGSALKRLMVGAPPPSPLAAAGKVASSNCWQWAAVGGVHLLP